MNVCVTGATGFLGAHLAAHLAVEGHDVRVTFREEERLARLDGVDAQPIRADVLDRAAMRRAVRGCDVVFHAAGIVGARPVDRIWRVNAVAPRVVVEAAAAEGVPRVIVTSSVTGIGPVAEGRVGTEDDAYKGGGLGLTYGDSKHEGESEAFHAGARLGVEVVVVNPSYVLGVPLDPDQPGETSTRMVGNYLRGRLPAVVDGACNFADVRDVAAGHLAAAERGRPGERYVLGGHDVTWPELIERVAEISGVRHPVLVIPRAAAGLARRIEDLGMSVVLPAEGMVLMAQNYRFSSAKAKRELGYRSRSLTSTVRATVEWYQHLIETGVLGQGRPSPMSLAASGLQAAGSTGALALLRAVERSTGRRVMLGG